MMTDPSSLLILLNISFFFQILLKFTDNIFTPFKKRRQDIGKEEFYHPTAAVDTR